MVVGLSAFPYAMTSAAPTSPAATAAPVVPTVTPATEGAATPAPTQPEAMTPERPVEAHTTPVGQVMPGVNGANAPIIADNAPTRDVTLTFAQIAPPPGSMILRGVNPDGGIEFGTRSDEIVSKAMLNLEYTPSPSLLPVQS
ncbi:MAG: cellulose synthase, subunit, partial [Enterobacter kobei]|nr:cellulose synthase, subunit [Enterobacter kobei]